jgi:hypothetical protein
MVDARGHRHRVGALNAVTQETGVRVRLPHTNDAAARCLADDLMPGD